MVEEVARACRRLAERRHGALLVLERETGLQDYADGGVEIDAAVSAELLLTIFAPNTPLHDGAVIIRGDRALAAGCVLPLTLNTIDYTLGTRHRAAIGITEQSDAIAVVVSEETGTISLANNGRIVRNLDEAKLKNILGLLFRTRGHEQGSHARWPWRRPVTVDHNA
jgi:diadenylate cyclase